MSIAKANASLLPCILVTFLSALWVPPAGAQLGKAQTGSFQLTIPKRSERSAIIPMCARLGWGTKQQIEEAAKKEGGEIDYNLSEETYEAYVPKDYDGKTPYGLIVWVNPGPGGAPPQHWLDVLDKHKLIWVGANNSGNNRTRWVRLGLAIDAADYLPTLYNIDTARLYVSGASGGGRCASVLAMSYPEVFTGGGYYIIGVNYFRIVELPKGPDGRPRYYRRAFDRPPAKQFELAAKERRHVFLTGDKDENRQQTEAYFEAAKKDGFRYCTYLQVPDMPHRAPDAEWFEKGIVALDDVREQVAEVSEKATREKPKPAAPAKVATAKAAPAKAAPAPETSAEPDPHEEANRLMRLARLYVNNRLYSKAREKLKQIIKDHPTSPPAAEAHKLLKEIGEK
ncbi:MAG TPA: PHB depolymerase family esterase [Tepidisphaeraceae bacterium]|nr:PHB depolymerase family esterase [Tepidisphaeraceae bacterium]